MYINPVIQLSKNKQRKKINHLNAKGNKIKPGGKFKVLACAD